MDISHTTTEGASNSSCVITGMEIATNATRNNKHDVLIAHGMAITYHYPYVERAHDRILILCIKVGAIISSILGS